MATTRRVPIAVLGAAGRMGVIRSEALNKKGSGTVLAAVVEPFEKGRLEVVMKCQQCRNW
jgi:dihydrodipicolinate reductase